MKFKLIKTTKEINRSSPFSLVGVKFVGNAGNHIFTITSYDPIKDRFRRNTGEGTPESTVYEYGYKEVMDLFKKNTWTEVGKIKI